MYICLGCEREIDKLEIEQALAALPSNATWHFSEITNEAA